MGDSSLRARLSATDLSAPTIQASASAMMRLYNSPTVAVSEWRNVLQSCKTSQLLPLLYVANEVMQISKRNRGNKFLEAFGPVLGGSLQYICERDATVTEKVRRTAKIWGDRRVFSLRFVGEILAGLEAYRNGGGASVANSTSNVGARSRSPPSKFPDSRLSNSQTEQNQKKRAPFPAPKNDSESDDDAAMFGADDDGDSRHRSHSQDSDNNLDEDGGFGNSGPPSLNVTNFSVNKDAVQSHSRRSSFGSAGNKRRRSHTTTESSSSSAKGGSSATSPLRKKNKKSSKTQKSLSVSNFVEQMHALSDIDSQYHSISNIISSITTSDLFVTDTNEEIQEVGDELTDLYTNINGMMENIKNQRRPLWCVAEGKKQLEDDLKRYLIWMKGVLVEDEDELILCDTLEEKLGLLQVVHADARQARDARRAKKLKEKAIAEAAAKKKAEDEELKRSLEKIQQGNDAPKAGMVWNKQAREYQYLADETEESWRD